MTSTNEPISKGSVAPVRPQLVRTLSARGLGGTVPTPLILMLHHSVMPLPPGGLTTLSLPQITYDPLSPSELPHYSKFSVDIAGP